jgi:hypothetical protein
MTPHGKDGVRYKIVFDKDMAFWSWHGQMFYFKKGKPNYVPHWELGQALRRGATVISMTGTPEQKIKYWYGGFDGVA